MTYDQKAEAVVQMVNHCRLLMDQYKAGTGSYETVSARGVLYTLGFESDVDEILAFIAEGGFDYCMDSTIAAKHSGERPPRDACYWGADQLQSRLECLSNVPPSIRWASRSV